MRRNRAGRGAVMMVAAMALIAVSCSDDGGSSSDTTEESEDTEAPEETDAPETTDTEPEDTEAPQTTEAPTTTVAATTTTLAPTTLPPVTLPASTAPPVTNPEEPTGTLFDEFDDDANQWKPEALDDEFATGEIADGFMTFSQNASFLATLDEGESSFSRLVWPTALDDQATALTDVRVETQLVMTRGASAGLACGIDPTNADLSFYSFTISSSGVVAIAEYDQEANVTVLARLPEGTPDAAPVIPDDPAFDYDPDSLYTVTAECLLGEDVAQLSLELDGELLLAVEDIDDPITSGMAGLQYTESTIMNAVEGFTPFSVVFDTFTLFDLNAGTGEPAEAGDFQSTCSDDPDDLIDDKGDPLAIEPFGIDLTDVHLDAGNGVMTVVWFLHGAPPAASDETGRGEEIFWSVGIESEQELIEIRVTLDGEQVTAGAQSNRPDAPFVDLTDHAFITGDSVAVDVPLDELPIPADFSWGAFAQFSDTARDVCPSEFGSVTVSTS